MTTPKAGECNAIPSASLPNRKLSAGTTSTNVQHMIVSNDLKRWIKLYATMGIIISILSYVYCYLIALFRIRNHPRARYIFAKIFGTQDDNPCTIYGYLEFFLLFCLVIPQFKLIMEHNNTHINHPIIIKRRQFLKLLYIIFCGSFVILGINLIRVLHEAGIPVEHFIRTPIMHGPLNHEYGTDFYYYHYFYSTLAITCSFIYNIIGFYAFPIEMLNTRYYHTTPTPLIDAIDTKLVKKDFKPRQENKAFQTLPKTTEIVYEDALAELNAKYPVATDIDIFGNDIPNNNDNPTDGDDDGDEDLEDEDIEDEEVIMERLDDLMDRMITKIEAMQQDVVSQPYHTKPLHSDDEEDENTNQKHNNNDNCENTSTIRKRI